MATRISVDRIAQLGVPVIWHEAVAVAQEIARRASTAGPAGLDTCLLSVSGAIELVGKTRNPFRSDPATETLEVLLDVGQAPRELVTLLESHKSEGNAGIGDLANELNFFARPDATSAIAALAARGLEADYEREQQAEFERLRADVADSTPKAKEKKKDTSRPVPSWAMAAAAALAVLGVIAVMAVGGSRTETGAESTAEAAVAPVAAQTSQVAPAQSITGRLESLVDKGLERLGLRAAEASAAAPEPAPPVDPKAARRQARRTPLAVPTTPLFVLMPPKGVDPSDDVGEEVVVAAGEGPLAPTGQVEEGDDSPLQPPVLRWPQLPDEPGTVPVNMSEPYLELLINEIGTVDKVRLHAPRTSYHERMLVSAAKAWVFHPAQKNGRAVRYLMKVPIIRQ